MAETDIADIVPRGAVLRVGKHGAQIVLLDEELESADAVDLDHGQRHPVAPLQLVVSVDPDHPMAEAELVTHGRDRCERVTTQPTPIGDVEDDVNGLERGWSPYG
jgi:hypothetical protein